MGFIKILARPCINNVFDRACSNQCLPRWNEIALAAPGRKEDDVGTQHSQGPCELWRIDLAADEHANPADGSIEYAKSVRCLFVIELPHRDILINIRSARRGTAICAGDISVVADQMQTYVVTATRRRFDVPRDHKKLEFARPPTQNGERVEGVFRTCRSRITLWKNG